MLRFFWQLCRGYWQSANKATAWALLTGMILLNLIVVYIMLLFNDWDKAFYDTLQQYDFDAFSGLLWDFAVLTVAFIVLYILALYVQQALQIKWRVWMTEQYLANWMKKQVYYRMKVMGSDTDNPDQRISEDISLFAELSLGIFIGFVKQLMTIVGFGIVLWELSEAFVVPLGSLSFELHGGMLWACLIYAVVGTYLAHRVGHQLIGLTFEQQRFEADFRFSMMRARENSESIAFYGGEGAETVGFKQRFAKVITNYWGLMRRRKVVNFYSTTFGQFGLIFPIFLVLPSYFNGTMQLGSFMQAISAFETLQTALAYFVDIYPQLAELSAVTQRLGGFTGHMEDVETLVSDVTKKETADAALAFENLKVQLPNGRTLLENCSLMLPEGSYTLITGSSGCGKSTLLRTIAGLWPFGHGGMQMPEKGHIFFLPQRPYLPMASLRRAVCYPQMEADDARLKSLLQQVGLERIVNQLDTEDDWSRILSLGEQQRIAFVRVLLAKPAWVFMDESTSALDENWEKTMYELIKKELPHTGIVSVGHRSSLFAQHEKELQLTGDGQWNLRPIAVS